MKLALQLAYRNLVGAGLRTWLIVCVLSFSYIVIIFFNGMLDGWNRQAMRDTVEWEYGYGHLYNGEYDPADPFTLLDGHGILPENWRSGLEPILLRQASMFPEGRMVSIVLKGIETDQTLLKLPTKALDSSNAELPVLVGKVMAKTNGFEVGDEVLIRWRDANGTFDARNVTIAGIFDTTLPSVDRGQMWMSIETLWAMTGLEDHATYFVADETFQQHPIEGWNFTTQEELLSDITEVIEMKKISSSIMYLLLLAIALLAIFDTQVLSIFRRQKEIGTYIALGMTRWQVVTLFTVEGSFYSILAAIVGSIYGVPLFLYLATNGWAMPAAAGDMGMSIAEKVFPVYSAGLVATTIVLVVLSSTIVSYMPSRKITRMDPVQALKGKIQ